MYISIRRYKVDPDGLDEAAQYAKNVLLPIFVSIPGFKGFYNIHAGYDSIVAISIFADKAGADESTRVALEHVNRDLSELLLAPPEIIEGDVMVSEVVESMIASL